MFFSCDHRRLRAADRVGCLERQVRYVCRPSAASWVVSQHVPPAPPRDLAAVRAWARDYEDQQRERRKNARIAERLVVALPRLLDREQRKQLLLDVIAAVTGGRTPALAALHDKPGVDDDNPHAHILVADRDVKTGRPVFGFGQWNAVKRLRQVVADAMNAALERWGFTERVDPRSYREQGVALTPQLHEGPGARRLAAAGRHSDRVDENRRRKARQHAERVTIASALAPTPKRPRPGRARTMEERAR